eukprot:TRINITY_DN14236_c1_g1_i1.p1 TRINITY_DN14236_c1_g1~~TRINITY_DN14236_c1_g1_i1.p1  ORF type:complete len:1493 (+),score=333.11 TRINITY_DN14236_c1_g1_i1:123-4601(+)
MCGPAARSRARDGRLARGRTRLSRLEHDGRGRVSWAATMQGAAGRGSAATGHRATHQLRPAHAFGVYPVALRDSVISLGDDAFLFCVGRQVGLYDYVTQTVSFLQRETKNRVITAATRSANSELLAVAERVGGEGAEGHAQISVLTLPETYGKTATGSMKTEVLKVLTPPSQNRRLDIVGIAFAFAEGKFLVSLSAMPDCVITYWRWEVEKALAVHECKPSQNAPMTRLLANPQNGYQISISGPRYMKIWEYNPNDRQLRELPSMLPGLHQEKQMDFVDHCWVLGTFLCAATSDGHVHLFEDGYHKKDIDVREILYAAEALGDKAKEKEQAKVLQGMLGNDSADVAKQSRVQLRTVAPWGRGFVVGGDQGYVGVFKVDAKMQVEPFGTFRMPGEDTFIYHMSAGSEDTHLTILSYREKESEDTDGSGVPRSMKSKGEGGVAKKERMWDLHSFPVGQADLAETGQLEVFSPVFALSPHHGPVLAMDSGGSRRVVATCGSDMNLKLWGYPSDNPRDGINHFSSELSISVSTYEKPRAVAIHPLGFQAAVILDDSVRIYHLTTQNLTRTLFELPLKRPGHVAYSNAGNMLAVTSENDVIVLDPWRSTVIHVFSGRGGHLSPVTQVLFSEDDRMLLSIAKAPHGAIYGWDMEEENKDRKFEHISKNSNYSSMGYDFRRKLVVTTVQPEGSIRVIGTLSNPLLDIPAEGRGGGYTALRLSVTLELLFAGTETGSVCLFKWPILEAGAAKNPFTEISIHAHSITSLAVTQDQKLLYTGCEGGSVFACYIDALAVDEQPSKEQLLQKYVRYRHRTDGDADMSKKAAREDAKKIALIQKKLTEAGKGMSTSAASMDELVLVPKVFFFERLTEIRELEEKMQRLRHESEFELEKKEQELQEKLNVIKNERKVERVRADEKYDNLFTQLKKSNERHQDSMSQANTQFDRRTQELQKEFEAALSNEYEKQSGLLEELQHLRDKQAEELRIVEEKNDEKVNELRNMQEQAMRDWRSEYDKVCNLLKSDGLKFEEALQQQESEYEGQITEILEHKRVALQVESEKSTTALKDGVSMRQTIEILHRQLHGKDVELKKAQNELEDTRKKLEVSQEMFAKQELKLKERERGLQVKDESLVKLREQMKHLESFRFVLFHKVKELEEERDPLEQQLRSLKTSVRDMYGEFVREFREKRSLDQELSSKTTRVNSMQKEINELQATLVQLKKDARRLFQEVETVLYAETAAEFHNIPKRLHEVIERHKKLEQWAPPSEDEGSQKTEQELNNEQALIQEMVLQRDRLFRKNQIAIGQASTVKTNCLQDFRRLMSENAQLISEMNLLRTEKKSMERSYKEMQATLMKLQEGNPAAAALTRNASAPTVGGGGGGSSGSGAAKRNVQSSVADTPYIRRKVVDQQELFRKSRQRQQNQLPPVADSGAPLRNKPTLEEKRFVRSLESVDAGRRHMEQQGFEMGRLTSQAAAMASFYTGEEFASDAAQPAAEASATAAA